MAGMTLVLPLRRHVECYSRSEGRVAVQSLGSDSLSALMGDKRDRAAPTSGMLLATQDRIFGLQPPVQHLETLHLLGCQGQSTLQS